MKRKRNKNGEFVSSKHIIQYTDWKIVVMALGCITILECFALHKGINGVILTAVIGVIAGLAGLIIPTPRILTSK